MKIISLVLATAVAAVAGSTSLLAQSTETPSDNAQSSGSQMEGPARPDSNQWARDREWYGQPGWQGGVPGYGRMAPWMMGPHHGWMMGQRPGWRGDRVGGRQWHRRPRGASFTFTRGNARVDIRCPANQSLKECVDAASTLIDKVGAMNSPPAAGQPPASTDNAPATRP